MDRCPLCRAALHGAEENQLRQALAHSTERGAHQKDDDRALEDDLSAVKVAKLAVHRRHHGLGEQVRGHHPGEMREAAEIADDGGQRGRDDCGIKCGQQHG